MAAAIHIERTKTNAGLFLFATKRRTRTRDNYNNRGKRRPPLAGLFMPKFRRNRAINIDTFEVSEFSKRQGDGKPSPPRRIGIVRSYDVKSKHV